MFTASELGVSLNGHGETKRGNCSVSIASAVDTLCAVLVISFA
jgi:hypothetical protein